MSDEVGGVSSKANEGRGVFRKFLTSWYRTITIHFYFFSFSAVESVFECSASIENEKKNLLDCFETCSR